MARDLLVTLDAGTGSGRCVVFDTAGRVVASAQEPLSYHFFADPDLPLVRGFDLDPVAFWDVLGRCARAAAGEPAGRRPHPRASSPPAQREGCVFLDADGEVLYAGPNLDARAVMQGMEVQSRISARAPARHHRPRAAVHLRGVAPPLVPPAPRCVAHRDAASC